MTPDVERAREFYELCQAYRHTPVSEFVAVREAYDKLVAFVRSEREAARKEAFEEAAKACDARAFDWDATATKAADNDYEAKANFAHDKWAEADNCALAIRKLKGGG